MVTSHTPDSSEGIHVDADYCADADDCAAADDCKELLDSPKNTILGEIPSFSLCFRDRSRSRRSTFFTDISTFLPSPSSSLPIQEWGSQHPDKTTLILTKITPQSVAPKVLTGGLSANATPLDHKSHDQEGEYPTIDHSDVTFVSLSHLLQMGWGHPRDDYGPR